MPLWLMFILVHFWHLVKRKKHVKGANCNKNSTIQKYVANYTDKILCASPTLITKRKKKQIHLPRLCSIDSKEKKVNKKEYSKNSQMIQIEDCKFWHFNQKKIYWNLTNINLVWISKLYSTDPY